jgi:DNA polymerase-3 subunit gamma/tau
MYQVIARKYRPQTFDEVVGQAHVKQTLRNAIDQGRIAHGYIFSGPRGTGKTTLARILAMALNCEGGPSSSADPRSAVCREIAAGGTLDVIEIDAASNRRIDDIRQLRESVRFRPVRDRYKVFIIDEAHQITSDAFNALLKTLEEPPEWAVFVLCTTEPQAIPPTIASRCQSFAFRSVDLPLVIAHLARICRSEGVEAESDALTALALAGDGSIRDSLSALDQSIAAFGKKLEAHPVRDLLGAIPSEVTERVLGAIRNADPAAMLVIVDDLFEHGRHPQHFCGELTRQFRNLMVMKFAGADSNLVVAGEREREAARSWTGEFSNEDLTRYVQILLTLYQDLQQATQQRFRLEIGLLKLVFAGRLRSIEELLSGHAPAEAAGPPSPAPRKALPRPPTASTRPAKTGPKQPPRQASPPAPSAPPPSAPPTQPEPAPLTVPRSGTSEALAQSPAPPPKRAPEPEPAPPKPAEADFKRSLLESITQSEAAFLADAIRSSEVKRQGRVVTFLVPEDWTTMMELQKVLLEAALVKLVGGKPDVRLVSDNAGLAVREQSPPAPPPASGVTAPGLIDVNQRALVDPAFLAFKKRFKGRVANVMDLRKKA